MSLVAILLALPLVADGQPASAQADQLKALQKEVTAKIQRDMADGQKAGVRGTPTFFVGLLEADGHTVKATTMLVGAQPYPVFQEAIEGLLSASR